VALRRRQTRAMDRQRQMCQRDTNGHDKCCGLPRRNRWVDIANGLIARGILEAAGRSHAELQFDGRYCGLWRCFSTRTDMFISCLTTYWGRYPPDEPTFRFLRNNGLNARFSGHCFQSPHKTLSCCSTPPFQEGDFLGENRRIRTRSRETRIEAVK
jgi:hypothetical protein